MPNELFGLDPRVDDGSNEAMQREEVAASISRQKGQSSAKDGGLIGDISATSEGALWPESADQAVDRTWLCSGSK